MMLYRRLGESNLEISVVSLGTWVMGGDQWGQTDDSQCIAAIQTAIDLGINLIDTAPIYGIGHAEEVVGKAIRERRDKVYIATKCGIRKHGGGVRVDLRPDGIRQEVEQSLSRLGIEKIDLYQCHWPDPQTPIENTLGEMLKMQREGKIAHIGVSNFDMPLLKKAREMAPVVSVQPHYSLLERKVEDDLLPFCRNQGVGVLAYGSLGSGILTGKYQNHPRFRRDDPRSFFYPFYKEPRWSKAQALVNELKEIAREIRKPTAQVALNWTFMQPGITSALVGARSPKQVRINAEAGEWQLAQEELAIIDSAYQRIFRAPM